MSLLKLFCDVDDFCQQVTQQNKARLLETSSKRGRKATLSASEIMTILIHFHQSGYRSFKRYYQHHVCQHLRSEFPALVSYNRFVELMPQALLPLCLYLHTRMGQVTGISFIDATSLPVCHNKRINRHKVFAGLAARGKTSMGWFYGFKLHLIINERGELLAFYITAGNVDARKPVPRLAERLFGKLFGDKGYISQALFDELIDQDVQLVTAVCKNMKNRLLPLLDKILLRKRALIETVNDQLKNISQVSHTRHRSPDNFLVNLLSGLIAYTYQPKKPSLNLQQDELEALPALI